MTKIHWVIVFIGFCFGLLIGYFRFSFNPETSRYAVLNKNSAIAACQGIHDQAAEDIAIFCNLIKDQMTNEQCQKTDYVRQLSIKLDPKYVAHCAGTLSGEKTGQATSSLDIIPADTDLRKQDL